MFMDLKPSTDEEGEGTGKLGETFQTNSSRYRATSDRDSRWHYNISDRRQAGTANAQNLTHRVTHSYVITIECLENFPDFLDVGSPGVRHTSLDRRDLVNICIFTNIVKYVQVDTYDRNDFLGYDRLVGLVVKASASRVEDAGVQSHFAPGFFRVESYE